jgi:glycosyltransferase involved in cell wall biosynthesis
MKVLVVSPFLPYPGVPHAGGKLVYFLLQTLAEKYSVSLVSRYYPGEERHFGDLRKVLSGLELVPASGPAKAGSLPSLWRTVRSYYRLCRMAREILKRERFDVCQVEFTETGVFWTPTGDVPAVLTCHDIIAKPAFRRYAASGGILRGLQWCVWKTKNRMEKRTLSKFARVFTLSEVDREWAERLYPGVPIRVLRYPGGLGFAGLARKEVPGRILFLGALNRPQNIESVRYFREKVWPAVRERVPGAEFRVAGGGGSDELRSELSSDPRVVITDFVEDIEQEYKSAAVFVAPILTGGGVIVKILDALAAGVPVVTTPYGNEGIRAGEGNEILVGGDPRSFAAHVLSLLERPGLRDSLGRAGKLFAERNFSPGSFAAVLEETYGGLGQ